MTIPEPSVVELTRFDIWLAKSVANKRNKIAKDKKLKSKAAYYDKGQGAANILGVLGELVLYKHYGQYPESLIIAEPPYPDPDIVTRGGKKLDSKCTHHSDNYSAFTVHESVKDKDLDFLVPCHYYEKEAKVAILGGVWVEEAFDDKLKREGDDGSFYYQVPYKLLYPIGLI